MKRASILFTFILLFLGLGCCNKLKAQSTVGTDFWVTFLPNENSEDFNISLIASGKRDCVVNVSNPYTDWSQIFNVSAGNTTKISIPKEHAFDAEASDQVINRAIRITTTDSITLYASNYEQYSFDVTNILPTASLGSNYIIQTYEGYSEFSIIATENNTTVNINLSENSLGHNANQPFTVTLNTGECYQVQSGEGIDFSGTTITSEDNKKIAVFAGNKNARVPVSSGETDLLSEQMVPTSYWGNSFVVTNSLTRTSDKVKVTAQNDNCQVRKNGMLVKTLNARESYEFEITDSAPAVYLETTEPSCVFLYLTGSDYGGENGDPSMLIINPTEQQIKHATFSSLNTEVTPLYHYVNIITETDNIANIKLDNNSISSTQFSEVAANPDYSYARVGIAPGDHTLISEGEKGFIAQAYGLGDNESYSYSVSSLAINLTAKLFVEGLNSSDYPEGFEFCLFSTDSVEFEVETNFEHTDIVWNFGDGQAGSGTQTTHQFTNGGDYTISCDIYKTVDGINTLVITLNTNIHVNSAYDILITESLCEGDSYQVNDNLIYENLEVGYIEEVLEYQTINGCDSIITLNLTVNPRYETLITESICEGDSYIQNGFVFENMPAGNHFDTLFLNTIHGCDSIIAINLIVNPIQDTLITAAICQGDSYLENGFTFENMPAGNYTDTLSLNTIYGCDSIVAINLTVNPIYDTLIVDTICQWGSYLENGFVFENMPAGNHLDTLFLNTIFGCDSIVRINLTVNPTYDTLISAAICEGESYMENNFIFENMPAGNYIDSVMYSTIYGCDSLVKIDLTVNPIYDTLITAAICQGDSYLENGFEFEEMTAGNYIDTLFLNTIYGCDSIVALNLTVNPIFDTLFIDTICQWDSYLENGFTFENMPAGNYIDTLFLNTIFGCDSIVALNLTVNPIFDTLFIDTICQWNDYYEHGFEFDSLAPGIYNDTLFLNTIYGCDSIVRLELTVGEEFHLEIFDTICQWEDYYEYGFEFDSLASGNYYDTLFLNTILGCDSIVELSLRVNLTYDTLFVDTICQWDDYYEHGFEIDSVLDAGMLYETMVLPTILGCDSVINLELFVKPSYDYTIFDSICDGESYHENNFSFDSLTPGNYYDTLFYETILGCDSIVKLDLFVGHIYDTLIEVDICLGDNYFENNFFFEAPELGNYKDTLFLKSIYNCDSVVKLDLNVREHYYYDIIDTICEGEDYLLYGLEIIQPEPGIYDLVGEHQTIYGCDSIFNVSLEVIHTFKEPTIVGLQELLVSTNMVSGHYLYSIDSIPGCTEYIWTIEDTDWLIYPNGTECEIIATTPVHNVIKVQAGNHCGTVINALDLHASFIGLDEEFGNEIKLYPNPTKDVLNIYCNNIRKVNIYNSFGQLISSAEYDAVNEMSINMGGLDNASYIVEIITNERVFVKQVIVIK